MGPTEERAVTTVTARGGSYRAGVSMEGGCEEASG